MQNPIREKSIKKNSIKKNLSESQRFRQVLAVTICLLGVGGSIVGCSISDSKSPRLVVIELFGAMEQNDVPTLASVLDIQGLMEKRQLDYALNIDTPRVFSSPTQLFEDLTNDGLTKKTWFSFQRVVGDEEIIGDSAFVDVSFVDRDTGIQTFNKFGVRKIGERWRIYSFRTMVAPQ